MAFAQRFGTIRSGNDVSLSTNTILNTTTAETGKTAFPDYLKVDSSATVYGPMNVGSKERFVDGTIRMYQPSVFSVIKIGGEAGQPAISFLRDDETTTEIGHIRADYISFLTTNPGATAIDYLAGKFWRGGLLVGNDDSTWQGDPKLLVQGHAAVQGTLTVTYGIAASTANFEGNVMAGTFSSTDTITAVNDIVAGDTIGSNSGNYNYAGTTITYDEPPVDAFDRVPILNGGVVSWPLMADGAALSSTQTFTGSNTFQSSSTFTGSVYAGTAVNKITTTFGLLDSQYFTKVSPSTGIAAGTLASDVMVSSISAATIKAAITAGSNITLTTTTYGYSIAASGGGSGPFDQAESSTTLSMGGFALNNASSVEFTNGAGTDWTLYGSTTAMLYNDFVVTGGTVTVISIPVAANSTYSVTGVFMFDPSSTVSGAKFAVDVPDDYASLRLYLDGISGTAAGYRTDEGCDTDATPNGNAFATYNAGEAKVHAQGFIKTGASGGTVDFQVIVVSAQTLRAGTQITMVKQP